MSAGLKFAFILAALFLYVLAGLALLAAAIASDLRPGEQDILERVLRREASLAVFIAVLFLLGLGFLVSLFVKQYVVGPRRLAREAELIASANPGHRIEPQGPAELRALAAALNDLAGRSQAAQEEVGEQIAAAQADLEEERNRLAALMAELTLAVLVCNLEGRILLYNVAAKELLGRDGAAPGMVGLGRSIFAILDRSLIAHALERIGASGEAAPAPAVHLTGSTTGGRLLRIAVAPVRDRGGETSGFVLILEDITATAAAGARRDALLRSLTQESRAAVANIRAAVESMVGYPQMETEERERFTAIIRDEAEGLSDRLDEALEESAADLRDQWSLVDTLGSDLLTAAVTSLEREAGVAADAEDGDERLWIKVDSYALVQALTHLARRLRAEAGITRCSLSLREAGSYVRLDVAWAGEPISEERLRAWSEEPLEGGAESLASTLAEVVERHGGELFSRADGGIASVRLLVPIAEPVAELPTAPRLDSRSRPEFYDFDLLEARHGDPQWDAATLAALAYTVFDTETTGLSPADDEIISIGAVRIVNGRMLRQESFDWLVDPMRPIDPASTAVHGISSEMLAGAPTIDEVLPQFARFAQDTVLVGHNLAFDLRFLELKEARTGVRLTQPVLDTLLLSAVLWPDEEDHSLEAMAARLGVSVVGRHTALGDAILTGDIFLKQCRLLATQGLGALGEVRDAARRTYLARVSDSLYAG